MIKDLLLLSCRSPFLDDDKIYPPLANLYLQSAIKRTNPQVNVTVSEDYDSQDNKRFDGFDAIGVSVMTPQREEARRLLKTIKGLRPEAKTIVGGPHVKFYLDDVVNDNWDFIVVGDGERTINRIVEGKANRLTYDSITPFEFSLWATKPARLENGKFLESFSYKLGGKKATTMMTSRGCPESCAFCEDAKTAIRRTPFDLLVEEVSDIKSLGYQAVYIFDDIFALNPKQTEPIARLLKRNDLVYRCNGQARVMTKEFMKMLKETGCAEIAFGAESGSQTILDNVKKRTTVKQNYQFVKWCKEFEIRCKAFLMIGLPGETAQTITETEEFIQKAELDDFQLAIYYPFKGTQIRTDIESGKPIDLSFEREGLGAYGQKGGRTEGIVRTSQLDQADLIYHRNRLVRIYSPKSHTPGFNNRFFEASEINYQNWLVPK